MFETIQNTAALALEHFQVKQREDGTRYIATDKKGETPAWLRDLCHEAHGDMLPDDHRYDMIYAALDAIANEAGEDEDEIRENAMHDVADGQVSVYHADRFKWLASHGARQAYVDEAVEELGRPIGGISDEIALGWYTEAEEVFNSVLQSLVELVEESEAA